MYIYIYIYIYIKYLFICVLCMCVQEYFYTGVVMFEYVRRLVRV